MAVTEIASRAANLGDTEYTVAGGWSSMRLGLLPDHEHQSRIVAFATKTGLHTAEIARDAEYLSRPAQEIIELHEAGTLMESSAPIPDTFSEAAQVVISKLRSGELTDITVLIPRDLAREKRAIVNQILEDFNRHCDLERKLCTDIIRDHLAQSIPAEQIDDSLLARVREKIRPEIFDEDGIPKATFRLQLALTECFANHIEHGNGCNPMSVMIASYGVDDLTGRLVVNSQDEGPGFQLSNVPDPTEPENLENPRGRGIMLMQVYADDASYNDAGNQATIIMDIGERVREALHAKEPFDVDASEG